MGALVATLRDTSARRLSLASASGAASVLLTLTGRPSAFLWPGAMLLSVLLVTRRRAASVSQAGLAVLIGAVPALVLAGAGHDLLGVAPAAPVSALLLLSLWIVVSWTFGVEVAGRVHGRMAHLDVWARAVAALSATGFIASALTRLLRPVRTTADRLAWAIWEEDNAQIVGIAREVLTDGPRGAELADMYGTAFVNLPLLLLRLTGGPLSAEVDPRLQAITVFTLSTILVIVLAGLAMALIGAFPHHVHPGRHAVRVTPLGTAASAVAVAVATMVAFSLLVVLPMRTGFLTFVWGLTLVLLGTALVLITPAGASPAARMVLVAHLAGILVLLLSSWPFISPGLAPLLLVPLLWVPWGRLRASVRHRPGRWAAGLSVGLLVLAAIAYWFARWGPAAEVISYGTDILLIDASGIRADEPARRAAAVVVAAAALVAVTLSRRGARTQQALGILGPVVGAGALYGALRIAAALLTDGELNYSGVKLLYGIVTLAITVGLLALTSQAARLGTVGALAALVVVVLVHQSSATASLHTDWRDRTLLGPQPHVQATIEAIGRTSTDLPIRCLPSPDTVVDDVTNWAAFTCVRWMEDAFNESRFHGHRFDLLRADDETFEATVGRILEESPSEYLFAYRFTMGPGWFGWAGPT